MPRLSAQIAGMACGSFLIIHTSATASEDVRHIDAHVHGEGELNFAVEGSQLHLELTMPAQDILGFESITSEAQEEQLHQALKKLETDLWQPTTSAKCQLIESHAYVPGHDEHNGHEDHHEKHEDHEGHQEAEAGESSHINITASYVFECSKISRLKNFGTSLFDTFSHSEMIRVQGFTSKGQLSAEISRSKPGVRF